MTEPAPAAKDSDSEPTIEPIAEAVRQSVASGQDVRELVQKLVVNLFRGKESTAATARAAVQGIVQTASDVVNRAAPDNADSVLRNVIDGVTTGLKSVAQSTQYALQEAAARGQRFASEDVDKAKGDLNRVSEILLDTVKYFSNRAATETGSTFRDLKTHAERAAATAAPVVKASVEALARHPLQAAGDAASTAVRGSQLTVGALLSAMSGALAGAAELLDPDRRTPEKSDDLKDPTL